MVIVFGVIILLSATIAYLNHRGIKKKVIVKLEREIADFIGQEVDIGDVSFNRSDKIDLKDIHVKNPEGFPSGELLTIKRLSIEMKYSELMEKRFYFRRINVDSPDLKLMRNRDGKLNISEKLMSFFKKKPSITYQIDEFTIQSGIINVDGDMRFRNENISLTLKDLSSETGSKTLIRGKSSYADGGTIEFDGWVFLKDDPKKMNLTLSAHDIGFHEFRDIFQNINIDAENAKAQGTLKLEGDLSTQVDIKSEINVSNVKSDYLHGQIKDMKLAVDALFESENSSLTIRNFSLKADKILSAGLEATLKNILDNPTYSSLVNLDRIDLSALKIKEDMGLTGIVMSNTMRVQGRLREGMPEVKGALSAKNIALMKDKKTIFKDATFHVEGKLDTKGLKFSAKSLIGKISTQISGTVKRPMHDDRVFDMKVSQKELKLTDIRETFWEIFPDSLLYAGMDGSLASDLSILYGNGRLNIAGEVVLNSLLVEGENGEYSIGPLQGKLPIEYRESFAKQVTAFPSFEREKFDQLNEYYSRKSENGFTKITIGYLNYGFRFIENINLWVKQGDNILNIGHFSGNIFNGKINGSAVIDFSEGVKYRAGAILKEMSMAQLCEAIEPIRGYISGKVDGIINLKGSGKGIAQLAGKADFWTYSAPDEETKISREFLKKVGGPALKAYLRDRKFDKGLMGLYVKDGFVIFTELEISNRNFFGMQDLSVKVAPFNNRIAIEHLMWAIIEAAQRAKEKE